MERVRNTDGEFSVSVSMVKNALEIPDAVQHASLSQRPVIALCLTKSAWQFVFNDRHPRLLPVHPMLREEL